jgi:uncharacterized sulfatase
MVQVVMTPSGPRGAPLSWLPLYELQRAFGNVTHLPEEEITLAEVLSAAGYATGMFGKWHLGLEPAAMPNARGFDTFHGLLSSNDQHPNPFYVDREITEPDPVDQTTLTRRYTDGAVAFIKAHRDEPFFVYMPHTFPHRPLHPSRGQRGRSRAGPYGDVVADLDRSVGRLVEVLEAEGVADNTLVIITSDNGPWFQGSPGPNRGRKTDLFDGGFRVPFVAYWPGTLPAGHTRAQIAMAIDVFPTVLAMAEIALPTDRLIDGRDVTALLKDDRPSPHEALYFYWTDVLGAVRAGDFKYHIRRPIMVGYALAPLTLQMALGPWLFDLSSAPDESYDVSTRHPKVFEELEAMLASRVAEDARNPRGFLPPPVPARD